ncbi:Crp/Fnr family transcriptional regulator [Geobacter pelophilus]|uniref:Crp/Fnr family transcriptional regulator n=1 Tax=Geoanaerobacter pelophilus TaxID=60036 RepID=A0AAW4KW29_9BACT|nr:Crp/Fnr family transcriptional regulator [Geoanaerobacter pelophilus]MBT0662884.1 Crp/Fnr family transcriptional regulator [Geoanaerobacter pelophilus]
MDLRIEPKTKPDGNLIKNIPFFAALSAEEVEHVDRLIIRKRFSKDQIVLFEEDTANYMYIVYSGKVRVVKLNDEGREQIITIHKKNDFFGEMSLLDGNTSPATVIAHEDCLIGLLSKIDFERYLLSHETIRRKIIDLLCSRLRDSWAMIKILSFDNAEHRVMAVLDRLQELYGVFDDRGVIINVKLTHQQIASYASVARETVTRVLNRLEKEGVIHVLENKAILLTKLFYQKFRTAKST